MATNHLTLDVVRWAAQECSWQMSGELSVARMVEAWHYAHHRRTQAFTLDNVLALGAICDPVVNLNGTRRINVRVGMSVKPQWQLVDNALARLVSVAPPLEDCTEAEATEWYRQYEELHPWEDCNGRTGAILYNWLTSQLLAPVFPPNLWDDPRR